MVFSKEYYQNNKERIIRKIRDWQKANPDKVRGYTQLYRQKKSSTKFSFYSSFLRPLTKLPAIQAEDLIQHLLAVPMPLIQFQILSMVLRSTNTQKELCTMFKIKSQGSLNRLINHHIRTALAPHIINFQTNEENVLRLILRFVIEENKS